MLILELILSKDLKAVGKYELPKLCSTQKRRVTATSFQHSGIKWQSEVNRLVWGQAVSQNWSWKVGPRGYCSAAAAEYTQEEEIGELPEQCLLQLVLSLTVPDLCARALRSWSTNTLTQYA